MLVGNCFERRVHGANVSIWNMNSTLQKAAALVKNHEFSIAAIQDLDRI